MKKKTKLKPLVKKEKSNKKTALEKARSKLKQAEGAHTPRSIMRKLKKKKAGE